jgi:hypothetical protein
MITLILLLISPIALCDYTDYGLISPIFFFPLLRGGAATVLLRGVCYSPFNTPLHPSQEGNSTGPPPFFFLIV